VGKIAEKAVCRSAELTLNALLQTVFWQFCHWNLSEVGKYSMYKLIFFIKLSWHFLITTELSSLEVVVLISHLK